MKVALVALGPTAAGYVELSQKFGSRHKMFDQTWVVNKFAGLFEADLIFHMDDFRLQERRAEAGNHVIGEMLKEMKATKTPIITSRCYEDYPSAEAYPLQEVVNTFGFPYFNGTVSYAIAYAALKGVTELSCFGCDFAWANTPQKVERGRACCEYWIGRAMERGMRVRVLEYSNLLDGGKPQLYGYDSQTVTIRQGASGDLVLSFEDKPLPTAEEIERRYDHTDFSNLKGVA